MNILAIVLGIISFILLILGVLTLFGIIFTKKVSIVSVGNTCEEPSGSTCTLDVTYKDKNGNTHNVPVNVKRDKVSNYNKSTKLYYKSGDPTEGLTTSDASLDRPLNIIGLILTVLGVIGIIVSIILLLMKTSSKSIDVSNSLSYPSYPQSPIANSGFY